MVETLVLDESKPYPVSYSNDDPKLLADEWNSTATCRRAATDCRHARTVAGWVGSPRPAPESLALASLPTRLGETIQRLLAVIRLQRARHC